MEKATKPQAHEVVPVAELGTGMRWLDTPRVWGTAKQKEGDEIRKELGRKVKEQFGGPDVKISFAEKGASSLVSLIETAEGKTILKITLDKRPSGEREFLEAWKNEGVSVPNVLEDGLIDGYPYTRMDFIDAKTLDTAHTYDELVQEGTYVELGRILRVMHRPAAEGYGRFIDGRGEFKTFADYLEQNAYIAKRVQEAEKNHLFNDSHGSLAAAKEILIAHVTREPQSSYCHGDYDACNIFDTEPLTVFDPGMFINNGYLDLGLAIVIALAHRDDAAAAEQLIEGYFGGEPYDARALQASILLHGYTKLADMPARQADALKMGRVKEAGGRARAIEWVRKYLAQNRHLLNT